MDELEIIEIRPYRRQTRTHWSVQRVSDKHWLRLDNTLAPPTDEGFKSRRKFKNQALAADGMINFQMAQVRARSRTDLLHRNR